MKARGITLLELMVAVALTGIVAWMALRMVAGEQGNFVRTREKVKMQADARDAVRILDEEIRNAGFAVAMSGSKRIGRVPSRCPEVAFEGGGASIRAGDGSGTWSTGDTVAVRFFEVPASGELGSCATGANGAFREIAYRLEDGVLKRRFRKDTVTAAPWVPFLDNVVSFQVRYGIVEDSARQVFDTTRLRDPSWWNRAGHPSGVLAVGGSGGTLEFRGFGATDRWAVFGPVESSRAGEGYRIRMRVSGSDSLLDPSTGYDSASLAVGFLDAGWTRAVSTTFRLRRIPSHWTPVEFYFAMPSDAVGTRRLFLTGRLRSGAPSGAQTLRVRDVAVERVGRGAAFEWVDSPTPSQMRRVAYVRFSLLAKTPQNAGETAPQSFTPEQLGDPSLPTGYVATGSDKERSHILFQRIVPVVNNRL